MAEAVLEAPTEEVVAAAVPAEALVDEASEAAPEVAAQAAPLIPEEADPDAPVVVAPTITIKKSWTMGTGVLTVVLGKLRWPT